MLNWLLRNYQYPQYINMEDVRMKTPLKNKSINSSFDFHKCRQPSKMSHSQKSTRTINSSVEMVFLSVCLISTLISPGENNRNIQTWIILCDPYIKRNLSRSSVKYQIGRNIRILPFESICIDPKVIIVWRVLMFRWIKVHHGIVVDWTVCMIGKGPTLRVN